jgi:hypothetical protein
MNKRSLTVSPTSVSAPKRINMASNIYATSEEEMGAGSFQDVTEGYAYIVVPRNDQSTILNLLRKLLDEAPKYKGTSILTEGVQSTPLLPTINTPKDWELFLQSHGQLKTILYEILKNYSKDVLTANLDKEDFETFKDLRRFLTGWFISSQLAVKHIDRHKKGLQSEIVRLDPKISNITIPSPDRLRLDTMIKSAETDANILCINSMVSNMLTKTITLLAEVTSLDINILIWAKAFRAVIRANAHLSDRALFKGHQPQRPPYHSKQPSTTAPIPSLLDFPPLPPVQFPTHHVSLSSSSTTSLPSNYHIHMANIAESSKTTVNASDSTTRVTHTVPTRPSSTLHANVVPNHPVIPPAPIHCQLHLETAHLATPTFTYTDPRTGWKVAPNKISTRHSTSDVPTSCDYSLNY